MRVRSFGWCALLLAACRPTAVAPACPSAVAAPAPLAVPAPNVPARPCAGAPALSNVALETLFADVYPHASASDFACLADHAAVARAGAPDGCGLSGPGLGSCDAHPVVLAAEGYAWIGFGWHVYRLDRATGALELVLPNAVLSGRRPGARLAFAWTGETFGWLVDPTKAQSLLMPEPTTVLWPPGPLAYAARRDCGWDVWNMQTGERTATLDPSALRKPCEDGDPHAFVTEDGHWLVGPEGVWDLGTGGFRYRPGGYAHVVSSDGRWLVSLEEESESGFAPPNSRLVVRELASGRVRGRTDPVIRPLTNGDPVELSADGRSVTVVDYAMYTFGLPALEPHKFAMLGDRPPADTGAQSAITAAARARLPAAEDDVAEVAAARAALDAASCHAGEWLLPRGACESRR